MGDFRAGADLILRLVSAKSFQPTKIGDQPDGKITCT